MVEVSRTVERLAPELLEQACAAVGRNRAGHQPTNSDPARWNQNSSARVGAGMKQVLYIPILMLVACEVPCIEVDGVVCPETVEPCSAAEDDGTGGELAMCTEFVEPSISGSTVTCGSNPSEIEVMSDDAVFQYGVTDYAFESGSASLAGLLDFQPLPEPIEPGADPWSGYIFAGLPGVATHDGFGQEWAGYFSRVCCPQRVVEGTLSAFPANPTCAGGGHALNPVPGAWCLDVEAGGGAGLCVYPCHDPKGLDCPEPATEFCDFTVPDPNGNAPGTCRYKSMPYVPTPHSEINP